MAFDPYDSCPCGSGKKFKWCCQEIYADIEEAFRLQSGGQHDAALRLMAGVVQAHSGNPEPHGRYAQLLAANEKPEEAEQELEKAFALNPNYPFGFLLRGQFRMAEGETVGALILFRKAADSYAPDAREPLAYVHELIADIEIRMNRPVAAKAALKRAALFSQANDELKQAIDSIFGEKSRFPECARKDYAFRRPAGASANWERSLRDAATGRLSDVHRVFTLWSQKHPEDAAAWFNLGLINAWLGDNEAGIEALAQSVERDLDENLAGEAWGLAEVLRCGHGLEADADYIEHRAVMMIREPQPIVAWLQEWERLHRLIGLQSDPQAGVLTALLLEETTSLVLSGASAPPAKLAGYLMMAGNVLQFWHPHEEALNKVLDEVRSRLGSAIGESNQAIGPIHFGDVVAEALLFPTASTTQLDAEAKIRSHAQAYFEDTWPHQPLKALLGTPPIDAAQHKTLRKRLRGVLTFVEDCAAGTSIRLYDFKRLRHKLGLDGGAEPIAATEASPAAAAARDFSVMNAAELAALDAGTLADNELEQAFRSALHLDARELAGKFARTLVERPAADDRYPFFNHLIAEAQSSRDWDGALQFVDAGAKVDAASNESRRETDYELRRGQILAKRGDSSAARETFERILAKSPGDLKLVGAATEAMLGAKQGAAALKFAEHGLARAREQHNRDLEGYFLELADAAKKQGN